MPPLDPFSALHPPGHSGQPETSEAGVLGLSRRTAPNGYIRVSQSDWSPQEQAAIESLQDEPKMREVQIEGSIVRVAYCAGARQYAVYREE